MRSFKVLLVLGFLLLGVETALACSCAPPLSPPEELKKATVVFSGKVIEIKGHKKGQRRKHPENMFAQVEVRFQVEKVWKGVDKPVAIVFTNSNSAACGYRFTKNETYLVYAYENSDGKLETGICSRTRLLEGAEEEIEELGSPLTSLCNPGHRPPPGLPS